MRLLGKHKCIITLQNLYKRLKRDEIYMVMDQMDADLHQVLSLNVMPIRRGNHCASFKVSFVLHYRSFKVIKRLQDIMFSILCFSC